MAMGRVCPDTEGVFGEKTAVLEADEEHTKARVALDFKYFPSEKGYSLFPGMVVVLEGINTNGKTLSVTEFNEVLFLIIIIIGFLLFFTPFLKKV